MLGAIYHTLKRMCVIPPQGHTSAGYEGDSPPTDTVRQPLVSFNPASETQVTFTTENRPRWHQSVILHRPEKKLNH